MVAVNNHVRQSFKTLILIYCKKACQSYYDIEKRNKQKAEQNQQQQQKFSSPLTCLSVETGTSWPTDIQVQIAIQVQTSSLKILATLMYGCCYLNYHNGFSFVLDTFLALSLSSSLKEAMW